MQSAKGNSHAPIFMKHGLKVSQGKINGYILSNYGEEELISFKETISSDFL